MPSVMAPVSKRMNGKYVDILVDKVFLSWNKKNIQKMLDFCFGIFASENIGLYMMELTQSVWYDKALPFL